jgi:DNA-binding MarR family transcriptional regulator
MARTHAPREAKDAVTAIFRAADRLRRHFTPLLESHGVTLQQYNVLRILRGAGDEGLCTLALAGRMIEQAPGITRLIDRLEAKSWVRRERSQGDRREVRCHITPAGLRLLAKLDEPVEQLDDDAVNTLSPNDLAAMTALMNRLHREPE